jgi:hypothetical protein
MHIRQLLYIHTKIPFHSALDLVNGVLFFIFFLFGRFIFQLRLAYHFYLYLTDIWTSGKYEKEYSPLERFTFGYSTFAQVSMIFLNFYWLQLIVRGLARKFSKKPTGDKKKKN